MKPYIDGRQTAFKNFAYDSPSIFNYGVYNRIQTRIQVNLANEINFNLKTINI